MKYVKNYKLNSNEFKTPNNINAFIKAEIWEVAII